MVLAVIFDVDGTLIDSVDLHARAWQDIFLEYGVKTDFQAVRDQVGKGGDKLMKVFLSKDQIAHQGEEMEAERAELFSRVYLPQVRPFPNSTICSNACETTALRSPSPHPPKTKNLMYIKRSPVSGRFWPRTRHQTTCPTASRIATSFEPRKRNSEWTPGMSSRLAIRSMTPSLQGRREWPRSAYFAAVRVARNYTRPDALRYTAIQRIS